MSIRKIRKDLWQLRIIYHDRTGQKQDLRRLSSGSFVEAKALEAELILLRERGELDRWVAEAQTISDFEPLTSSMTLTDFSLIWLRDHVKPCLKPSSYQSAEGHLRIHVIPVLGLRPLEAIRPKDISDLLRKIAEARAPHTANNVRATLQSLFAAAVRWEVVSENPISREKVPWVKERRTGRFENFLTPEEARAFLTAIALHESHRERFCLYLFLLETGVRFGEAAALRKEDLDLTKGQAAIYRSVRQGIASSTKGDDERMVGLSPTLVRALELHLGRMKRERTPNRHGLVFPSVSGGFQTPESLRWSMKAGLAGAGVMKHVTIHGLRHSFCTALALDGRSALEIAYRAGHAQAATSERYIHLAEASRVKTPAVIERMGAGLLDLMISSS